MHEETPLGSAEVPAFFRRPVSEQEHDLKNWIYQHALRRRQLDREFEDFLRQLRRRPECEVQNEVVIE